MGNLITKPGLPNQPPLRQLQHKVLRYIYHDHSDNQGYIILLQFLSG